MKRIVVDSRALPAELDERERLSTWREIYSVATLRATEVSGSQHSPFSASSQLLWSNDAIVGRFESTAQRVSWRTPEDPSDWFSIGFNTGSSRTRLAQQGREQVITRGGASFFCVARPTAISGEGGVLSWASVSLPSKNVLACISNVEDLILAPIDPATPALRHLRAYLGAITDTDGMGDDPALVEHISTTLVDLFALALDPQRDIAEIAKARGLRAARLRSVLAELNRGFSDPAFSVHQVARILGVSPSYIQKLLHETGSSFTERMLELRLQKARRLLTVRRTDALKASDIALACGFNEVSYFNRCFRRRFGDTPTAYRGSSG